MRNPDNILNALPAAGAFIPQNALNGLPTGAFPPNVLAALGSPPDNVADALEATAGVHPNNILRALPSIGEQSLRPYAAATNSAAWGHPGQATFVDGYNNFPPGFNRFTRGIGLGGLLTCTFKMSDLTDPGVNTDFYFVVTMRSDMNDTTSTMEFHADVPGFVNLVVGAYGNPGYTGGGVVTNVTGSFVEYTIPMSPSEAAHINFIADMDFTFNYGGVVFNGGQSHYDVTNIVFHCPAA